MARKCNCGGRTTSVINAGGSSASTDQKRVYDPVGLYHFCGSQVGGVGSWA
jgi:ribosomal protein L28